MMNFLKEEQKCCHESIRSFTPYKMFISEISSWQRCSLVQKGVLVANCYKKNTVEKAYHEGRCSIKINLLSKLRKKLAWVIQWQRPYLARRRCQTQTSLIFGSQGNLLCLRFDLHHQIPQSRTKKSYRIPFCLMWLIFTQLFL